MKSLRPIYVLIGPRANPRQLAKWAHEEFRKSSVVAFIAVDSGFEPLKASGLPPTLVIGDLDGPTGNAREKSILRAGIPLVRLRTEKDESDLAVALEFCAKRKAEIIYAYGFQSGRADHEFAVHLDLSEASTRIRRIVSVGESGKVFYLSAKFSPLKIPESAVRKTPQIASIFPIGGVARGVRFQGLKYPPEGGVLRSSSQGLSNVVIAREVAVSLRQGRLAIFFPNE